MFNKKSQVNIINTVAIFIFLIVAVRNMAEFYYSVSQESNIRNDLLSMSLQSESLKALFDEERRYSLDKAMFFTGRQGGFICQSSDINKDNSVDSNDFINLSSEHNFCIDSTAVCDIICDKEQCELQRLAVNFTKPSNFLIDTTAFFWRNQELKNIPSAESVSCSIELLLNNYFNEPMDNSNTFKRMLETIGGSHAQFGFKDGISFNYSNAKISSYSDNSLSISFLPVDDSSITVFASPKSIHPYYDEVEKKLMQSQDISKAGSTSSLFVSADSRFVKLTATTNFFDILGKSRIMVDSDFKDYFKSLDFPFYTLSPIKNSFETHYSCKNDTNCYDLCNTYNADSPFHSKGFDNGTCVNNKCICKTSAMFDWVESIIRYEICNISGRKCADGIKTGTIISVSAITAEGEITDSNALDNKWHNTGSSLHSWSTESIPMSYITFSSLDNTKEYFIYVEVSGDSRDSEPEDLLFSFDDLNYKSISFDRDPWKKLLLGSISGVSSQKIYFKSPATQSGRDRQIRTFYAVPLGFVVEDFEEYLKQQLIYAMVEEGVSMNSTNFKIIPYSLNLEIDSTKGCDPFVLGESKQFSDLTEITGAYSFGSEKEKSAKLSLPIGFLYAVNISSEVEKTCQEVQ